MKNILIRLMFYLGLCAFAFGAEPIAQATFFVTDDFGNVVSNAPVSVLTFSHWEPGSSAGRDKDDSVTGITDTNGLVVLKLPSKTGSIRYLVRPSEGGYLGSPQRMDINGIHYYRDSSREHSFTNGTTDEWKPWNPILPIQIKAVLNPIPMYAKFYGRDRKKDKIPEYGKAIGFDLMKGDWVAPHGKGEISDFIFKLDCTLGGMTSARYQIYDANLELSFSNEGDGIQPVYINSMIGSVLRMPRFAPESGYATNWVKKSYHHEDESLYETREDQNYFFRIRTKRNDDGEIVSALYGKIHGDIGYRSTRVLKFKYYLNPSPNDRNMEFNTSHNLFK